MYTNGLNKWAVETMGYKLSGYGLRSIGRGIEVYRRSIGINFIYFFPHIFRYFADTVSKEYRGIEVSDTYRDMGTAGQ